METLDLSACGVRLERAGKRHAREMGRVMSAKDREEILASGGFIPEPAVRASINRSVEAWAAYAGDDLLCVFGVSAMRGGHVAWAMSTVHVARHRRAFWQASKLAVSYLRDRYPVLVNMVHGRYAEALRWLERLGFKIAPPERFGVRGDLFCRATLVTRRVEVARV